MFFVIMFGMLWIGNNEMYRSSFNKSIEATYANSELKQELKTTQSVFVKRYPAAATILPIGYYFGTKREVNLTSNKMSIIPNTITTYRYDHNSHSGSVVVTWRY